MSELSVHVDDGQDSCEDQLVTVDISPAGRIRRALKFAGLKPVCFIIILFYYEISLEKSIIF